MIGFGKRLLKGKQNLGNVSETLQDCTKDKLSKDSKIID